MKRNLIALAVAAAFVAPVSNAAPKVYGKINISAEAYSMEDESKPTADIDKTQMTSNASRFGLKGEDELTANLSAVYGIEWEVSAEGDDVSGITATTTTTSVDNSGDKITSTSTTKVSGSKLDLTQRNRFLGLKHQALGTVKMGHYDSYTKLAQGKVDLFNDYFGDMKYTIAGENRLKNVLGYESPKFANTQISVMAQTQDAASNGTSLSVVHDNKDIGLYLALAMDNNVDGKGATITAGDLDVMRLVVSYTVADLTLNALYNTAESEVSKQEETAYLIGAAYKMADVSLKAQYAMAEIDKTVVGKTTEKTQMSVGADYKLSSKAKIFAWYSVNEEVKDGAKNDIEANTLAVGIEHNF
jgi:predicted porin